MRYPRWIGGLAVAAAVMAGALAALATVTPAQACFCAPPLPPHMAFDRADAVFAGEIIEIQQRRTIDGRIERIMSVRVTSTWKGPIARLIDVVGDSGDSPCPLILPLGTEHLLYVSLYDNAAGFYDTLPSPPFQVDVCSRTVSAVQADYEQWDLAYLGEGIDPRTQMAAAPLGTPLSALPMVHDAPPPAFTTWQGLGLLIGGFAAGAVGVWAVLRRRRA